MLAPPQRHKRPRSPSPSFEPDLASPLDMILKRRRREERFWITGEESPGDTPTNEATSSSYFEHEPAQSAESSATALRRSMAGVERRRTRHWERQNAPVSSSQPSPGPAYLSPGPSRDAYPQPDPLMSSSPIRNHPPSSSPFRDKSSSQNYDNDWLRAEVVREHDASDAGALETDVEEMRREWGEEYATQNSLLHSLHLARLGAQTYTPDSTQTLISTPTLASPQSYRQTNYFPDSSPFHSHSEPHVHAHHSDGVPSDGPDEEMEILDDVDVEVKRRYEETNRLLGELEVVRRRRWGET